MITKQKAKLLLEILLGVVWIGWYRKAKTSTWL